MKIFITSVFVADQEKALKFYTKYLGFIKKEDVSLGQYRWLTVISPDGGNDTQLLLEPNQNPAAQTYQKAIFEQGIPATMFSVTDVQAEYERLKARGVKFTKEPTNTGPATIAVLDDTCGNLIQIAQFNNL
jgi:catechol 2,3-dioxygenase-like lactoylglutathione lyase family enzyme